MEVGTNIGKKRQPRHQRHPSPQVRSQGGKPRSTSASTPPKRVLVPPLQQTSPPMPKMQATRMHQAQPKSKQKAP